MIIGKKLIAAPRKCCQPLVAWSDDHNFYLAGQQVAHPWAFVHCARERERDTATITTATRRGNFGCHRGVAFLCVCVCVWVFFCALSSVSLSVKGKNYTKRKMCVDWSQLPFAAADCRLFILLLWTTSAKCWQVKCETHTDNTHTYTNTHTHTHTPSTCTFDSCSLQFICTPKCNSNNKNMQWERNNNNSNATITMARLNELSEARA